jgi:hypothetical protein
MKFPTLVRAGITRIKSLMNEEEGEVDEGKIFFFSHLLCPP